MNAEECRKNAEECINKASLIDSPEKRAPWLMIAQSWLRLAEQVEQVRGQHIRDPSDMLVRSP
jgi:hypothetical protein